MNPLRDVCIREELELLRASGYGRLLEALADPKAYTKQGRLKKAALARIMGTETKTVEVALRRCREILGPDA